MWILEHSCEIYDYTGLLFYEEICGVKNKYYGKINN